MNSLNNLRIASRMALGFGSVLLLLAMVVAVAALRFDTVANATDSLLNETWVKAEAVADLDAATRANGTRTLELLLTTDADRLAELRARIRSNRERATAALDTLQKLVRRADGRQMLAEIVALRGKYVRSFQQVDADVANGRLDAATERCRNETIPLLDQLQEKTSSLSQLQSRLAKEAGDSMNASVKSGLYAIMTLGLCALAVGVVFAWYLSRSISRPVGEALGVAGRIAAGDLTADLQSDRLDEVGDLLRAMGEMTRRLSSVVGSVRGNAECVATASSQIAQGNLDLSQRTEEQASALQQTAASMEQLNAAVQQNAANARQANDLAQDASRVAGDGGQAVAGVVSTMQRIQEESRRVGDIIGTIDGIAFQTNILALNAAVEAARAGDQGRGFAVVAGEVRALAQRTAAAAREIKKIISANVEHVAECSNLAANAGSTMDKVVSSITRVRDIVCEISEASTEQSTGVNQVGEAVAQMDQVTQQNAALVEESAAAAESLKVQAAHLVGAVARFHL